MTSTPPPRTSTEQTAAKPKDEPKDLTIELELECSDGPKHVMRSALFAQAHAHIEEQLMKHFKTD